MAKKFKINWHRNPAERSLLEKFARRFILPPHGPRALRLGRWSVREDRLKGAFPIRFWVWETVPDWFRDNIKRKYRDARNWVRFRTWDRYDLVRLDIDKNYHDPDERMIYANFQILRDYVEIELASMQSIDARESDEDIGIFLKKFSKMFRRSRRRNIRQPDLGVQHLDWEIRDTSGSQQTSAVEKKELYLWWTQTRPRRAEPYGDLFHDPQEDTSQPIFNRPYNRELSKARQKLESFYEAEDEEMLVRLMKIRKSLWT